MRVEPPAGVSVARTIYINQARIKNAHVTAYVHIVPGTYQKKTIRMKLPAEDVPKTIYINHQNVEVCAKVTACQRAGEKEERQKGGTSCRGERSKNSIHKPGNNEACKNRMKIQRENPQNKKRSNEKTRWETLKRKTNASAVARWQAESGNTLNQS